MDEGAKKADVSEKFSEKESIIQRMILKGIPILIKWVSSLVKVVAKTVTG